MYPSYLIHFNKNHSKANGQFVSGDGDGDGRGDEHHRYTKTGYNTSNNGPPQQQIVNSQQLKLGAAAGKWLAGKAFCATKFGKLFKDGSAAAVGKIFLKSTGLDKIWKDTGFSNDIAKAKERMYNKAANKINTTYSNGGLSETDKRKLKVAGVATGAAVAVGAGAYGMRKLGENRTAKYNHTKKITTTSKDKWFNPETLVVNKSNNSYAPKVKNKKKYRVTKKQYLPR